MLYPGSIKRMKPDHEIESGNLLRSGIYNAEVCSGMDLSGQRFCFIVRLEVTDIDDPVDHTIRPG